MEGTKCKEIPSLKEKQVDKARRAFFFFFWKKGMGEIIILCM